MQQHRENREPDPNEYRERTGDNRSKYRKFQLDTTENIFTMRMVKHWTSQRDGDQLPFQGKKSVVVCTSFINTYMWLKYLKPYDLFHS